MTVDLQAIPVPVANSPVSIQDYCGLWAIDEVIGQQIWNRVRSIDLHMHMADPNSAATAVERNSAADLTTTNSKQNNNYNIAVLQLKGTLAKQADSMSLSTSTIRFRQQVRDAERRDDIDGVMLVTDTPGGTVAGTFDASRDLKSLAAKKPVVTYVEDMMSSAGYWIGSSVSQIIANNETAMVGSIGTYLSVYDWSKAFEKEGIKAVVIKTGELKAAGVPGTEITEKQIEYFQGIVNKHQAQFDKSVRANRSLSADELKQVNTGGVFVAEEAKDLKLIDSIGNFDHAMQSLVSLIRNNNPKASRASMAGLDTQSIKQETPTMSEDTTTTAQASTPKQDEPKAASFADIVATCKGIDKTKDADRLFISDCLERGTTAEQARDSWTETLAARAQAAEERAAEAEKAKAETPAPKKRGHKPLADGGTGAEPEASGSAADQFQALVDAKVAKGKPRHTAHAEVCRQNPELRAQWVEEVNAG